MVDTIKFSQFTNGGDLEPNQTTVGLDNTLTINTRFSNPFPLLPPGTTGDRPAPAANMYYRLRFNTSLELYEYYSPTAVAWIQLEAGIDILPLLASHLPGEGASLIGLQNQGGVLNKFVQDLANAALIAQNDNGTLFNGVFLDVLPTGFLSVTTGTGALASRVHTGTANQIDIANGNGAANPVYSLSATLNAPGTFTIQSSTAVDSIINDNTLATATATNLATALSIKTYIDNTIGTGAGGVNGNVQFNDSGIFGGDPNFNTDGNGTVSITGQLSVDNININGNTISTLDTNGNVDIVPNGTGFFQINTSQGIDEIINDPTLLTATANNLASALAIKVYIDSVASGITFLPSGVAATTAALNTTYNNGASGVGATLTANVNGALSIDGVSPILTDRILVKNQAAPAENGVYFASDLGSAGTPYVLTRSPDFDSPSEIVPGVVIPINLGGTVNGGTSWLQTSTVTTVGTDPITWIQFTATLPLSMDNGGTGANLTPSNGGIVYCGASTLAILAGTATANQIILSGINSAPSWSSATYLSTITANAILYGSSSNVMGQITPAANSVLATNGSSVPALTATLPSAVQLNITQVGTISTGLWQGTQVGVPYGGTGNTTFTAYSVICAGTTATGAFQNVSGLGTLGQVLTSNGAAALPSWQNAGGGAFPSGTAMLFKQTSAPTGWTKDTSNNNNSALRVVTGTASTGGTVDFTTAFVSQTPTGTIGNTTLTTAQIPAHVHPYGGLQSQGFSSGNSIIATTGSVTNTGNNAGGGGSHTHSFTGNAIDLAVKYVDVIVATKD